MGACRAGEIRVRCEVMRIGAAEVGLLGGLVLAMTAAGAKPATVGLQPGGCFVLGSWFVEPAEFDPSTRHAVKDAGLGTFADAVAQLAADRAFDVSRVLLDDIAAGLAKQGLFKPAGAGARTCVLQVGLLQHGLLRRAERFEQPELLIPPQVYLSANGAAYRMETLGKGVEEPPLRDRDFYPTYACVIEVLNERNELVWTHRLTVDSSHDEIIGDSQKILLEKPERFEQVWKRAARIGAELIGASVRRHRAQFAKEVAAGREAIDLPPAMSVDGQWVCMDAKPVRLFAPEPPAEVVTRGVSGKALVDLLIAEDGTVLRAKTVESQPADVFSRAAEDAVQKWRFQPARGNGRPVTYHTQHWIVFDRQGRVALADLPDSGK